MNFRDSWLCVRLVLLIAQNIGDLLNLLNKSLQGGPESEYVDNRDRQPNARSAGENDKNSLPHVGLHSEGIVKSAGRHGGDECDEKRGGGDPLSASGHASNVLAEAEFQFISSDNDNLLFKINMISGILDKVRTDGIGKFSFWRVGGTIHFALLSGEGGGVVNETPSGRVTPSAPSACIST